MKIRSAPYRGQGHGKLLLEHALSRGKALGFTSIELTTASVLKEAILLYKKYGFKPLTKADIPCRCDQAYFKEL